MNHRRGFTLVELIAVIVVIGILSTLVIIGATRSMADTRDQQRVVTSTALVEKLEAYYLKNGEYPSVPSVASDKGASPASVANKLGIETGLLKMPKASSELSVVSVDSPAIGSDDVIVYDATSTINKEACSSQPAGGCDLYTLHYTDEQGNEIVLNSRRDNTLVPTVAIAPLQPSLDIGQDGTSVYGESSNPNCDTNADRLVAKYRFRYQVNSGSWVWSNWQIENTYAVTGTQGSSYSMQVMVRCDDGPMAGAESPLSATETFLVPVGAPQATTVTVALNGNSRVQATSTATTCAAGNVAQYAWRTRTNGGSWGSYSAFSTSRVSGEITPAAGVRYGFTFQARCFNTTTSTASGAASSVEKAYIHPFSTPAAPSISVNQSTRTWSWSTPNCPTGGTKEYQYRFLSSITTGGWVITTSSSATNSNAVSQGINYGLQVQMRCKNSNTTGAWSPVASTSFTVPVVHAQLHYWAVKMRGTTDNGLSRVKHKTFSRACASGLVRESKVRVSYNTPGKNEYYDATPWFTVNENTERDLTDDPWGGAIWSGEMVEFAQYTRCRNTTTNYVTDSGGYGSSRNHYDIGNLYMTQDGTKFKISCAPNAMAAYCAAGHSANGTLTNSSLRPCAARSVGISDTSERYTALYSLGANPPCW